MEYRGKREPQEEERAALHPSSASCSGHITEGRRRTCTESEGGAGNRPGENRPPRAIRRPITFLLGRGGMSGPASSRAESLVTSVPSNDPLRCLSFALIRAGKNLSAAGELDEDVRGGCASTRPSSSFHRRGASTVLSCSPPCQFFCY